MTEWLRKPAGTMQLREIQASALLELTLYRGLFAAARVGAGKTLIAGLAPTVFGAKRPLFVCPANMLRETKAHLAALRTHWRLPHLPVISYHKLSSKKHARFLWDYAPDLLIFDEAHKLKRVRSAACARITARFLHETPTCGCAILTGTPARDSFLDYAHLLQWAVRGHAPFPADPDVWESIAQLLDDEDQKAYGSPWLTSDYSILEPWIGGPITTKAQARERFAKALHLTPGVVISTEGYSGVGLEVNPIFLPSPDGMNDAWVNLRENWAMPDDWLLLDKALGVWSAARQFQDGFYYYHDPRPPTDWLDARREWGGFCRRILEDSDRYDTETRVRDACLRGDLPDHAWRRWETIQPSFTPVTKPMWLSTHALEAAEQWGRDGGIIWTPHTIVGQELSELTGWPYYGAEGLDRTGEHITRSKARTIIASEKANSDGRNLQIDCGPKGEGYHRNLLMQPPKAALDFEQRIGRTHRDGQKYDVTVDYFVGCLENWRAIQSAVEKAKMTESTLTQVLKLVQQGVEVRLPPEAWLASGPAFGLE